MIYVLAMGSRGGVSAGTFLSRTASHLSNAWKAAWKAKAWKALSRVTEHKIDFEKLSARFVVSIGRTGTNFIAEIVAENFEGVHSVHEPNPDFFTLGSDFLRGKIPDVDIVEAIRRERRHEIAKCVESGASMYLESNPHLIFMLPQVRLAFPNNRVLFVTREPRGAVRSLYNKSPTGDGKMFTYAPDDHRERMCPADLSDDPHRADWDSFTRFEKVCWFWSAGNGLLYRQLKDDRAAKQVRYEDLFIGNERECHWRETLEFLGLMDRPNTSYSGLAAALTQRSNVSQHALLGDYTEWSEEQKRQHARLTETTARMLGYA